MTLKQLATYNLCFNPRTREGATFCFRFQGPRLGGFNPRTREGATVPGDLAQGDSLFQSTHP